jgi:hypothetical protein
MGTASLPGLEQIFLDLMDGTDSEPRAILVDHAKSASIVGTANRSLDKKRVRFTRGAVNGAFVSHRRTYNSSQKCESSSKRRRATALIRSAGVILQYSRVSELKCYF